MENTVMNDEMIAHFAAMNAEERNEACRKLLHAEMPPLHTLIALATVLEPDKMCHIYARS
jgi:hypothetical protein